MVQILVHGEVVSPENCEAGLEDDLRPLVCLARKASILSMALEVVGLCVHVPLMVRLAEAEILLPLNDGGKRAAHRRRREPVDPLG